MHATEALFEALREIADPSAVDAIETLVREGADEDLAQINAMSLAEVSGTHPGRTLGALVHAARIGLLELSWNILCPSCRGILAAKAALGNLRNETYRCAFCAIDAEPVLDDTVEVSFSVSPRVRRISAHDPDSLGFWDYLRQVFFSTGLVLTAPGVFREALGRLTVRTAEVGPGADLDLELALEPGLLIVFDPVTHTARFIHVDGPSAPEPQATAMVFGPARSSISEATLRPGALRLTLSNRSAKRVLPGVFAGGPDLLKLLHARRPSVTGAGLLSNQTFREIYKADTLDIDEGLKVLNLTFLFTDLRGSTALYESIGDFAAYDLVRAHFRVLGEIIDAEGGAVVKTIGDAIMATFTSPGGAVAASLRMREAMGRLNAGRPGESLILKIGIHSGPCLSVNSNERQDYFGRTVNIASRVQELATADGILLAGPAIEDAATRRLLEARGIPVEPRERRLRGIDGAVQVLEI